MAALISEICTIIIGFYMALCPAKYVEGMNKKRNAKGKTPFSDEEMVKKAKTIRIIGIIAILIAGIFLASDILGAIAILS